MRQAAKGPRRTAHGDQDQAAAWFLDVEGIYRRLSELTAACRSLRQPAAHSADLCGLAQAWQEELLKALIEAGPLINKKSLEEVCPPYSYKEWKSSDGESISLTNKSEIRIATFGWWEIRVPTKRNLNSLIQTLVKEEIMLCGVTGLPIAAIVAELEHTKYVWKGELHDHNGGSGFLLHRALLHQANLLPQHPPTGHRLTTLVLGDNIFQVAYCPHIGRCNMQEHQLFLSDLISHHVQVREQHPKNVCWLMGDFNLRGLAPGNAAAETRGSAGARIVAWLREVLRQHQLGVVTSEATHVRGGALDVHITIDPHRHCTKIIKCPHNLSDHFIFNR